MNNSVTQNLQNITKKPLLYPSVQSVLWVPFLAAQLIMKKLPFGFRVYILWAVIFIVALLPVPTAWSSLSPLWRILTWIAPTMLALDCDAGNRQWIYHIKAIVWVIMQGVSLFMLKISDGFTRPENKKMGVSREVQLPIMTFLFVISCTITLIGHRLRKNVFAGSISPVKSGPRVSSIEKKLRDDPYANKDTREIRTPLKPKDLEEAWVYDADGNKPEIDDAVDKQDAVDKHILRISILSQYVVGRIFKCPENKFSVYSPVALHRARILVVGLALAGTFHVGRGFFRPNADEAELVQSLLLWLTLPTITLPALLRLKFGPRAQPVLLLRGILPVDYDKELWLRLNIEPHDLYAALTNADGAETVIKESVGIISSGGVGRVHVTNLNNARKYCEQSLIRIGRYYVRISDGKRFAVFKPGQPEGIQSVIPEEKNNTGEEVQESQFPSGDDVDRPSDHHIVPMGGFWKSGWSAFVPSMSSFKE